MENINLEKLADELEDLFLDEPILEKYDTDCRSYDDKIIIFFRGDRVIRFVAKRGVVALYEGNDLKDVFFDCDHIYTDNVETTAIFFLCLCGLRKETEYLGIE